MKCAARAGFGKTLAFAAVLCFEVLAFGVASCAWEIEVKIKVASDSPSRARVEGRFLKNSPPGKTWSFLRDYADVSGLEKRIENFRLFDEKENEIEVKKLAAGEFLAVRNPASWQYDVKIEVPPKASDSAHVSWLAGQHGLLMLNDLLPQLDGNAVAARVSFELPGGWRITSAENKIGENEYGVKDVEKAVFLVGKDWREKSESVQNTNLSFAFTGEWQFAGTEAAAMANSILREHIKVFGKMPPGKIQIFLLPFPQNSDADGWRAETRGSTTVIISGVIPYKSRALQRLHEQLRHELFHLWLPNVVNLSGNYDWFYEGFAVYQALKTGVTLNQIRFQDFLDALAQAFDLAQAGSRSFSLVEASRLRWRGAGNIIYAKGMLVAFLCDVAILRASRGKRSLADVFRQIYRRHQFPSKIENANTAILRILDEYVELQPAVKNYIRGNSDIDWASDLAALGIEIGNDGAATRLKVKEPPAGRRKDLLDKLGYNQWRKLLPKQK